MRQARLAKQLELREITKVTKIQPWVLEALETDELHRTMSTIYVKSFLGTYAKYLQLDGVALINQLFMKAEPVTPVAAAPAVKAHEAPFSVGQYTPSPAPRPREERPVTVATPAGPSVIEQAWTVLWPLIRRVAVFGAGIAAIVLLVRVNPLQQLASRVPRREAGVSVPEKFVPPSEAPLRLPTDQPLSLEVTASRPTWVSVKADGKLVSQQQLASGSKEHWHAARRFELVVGSPSKVDVALNGQSITPRLAAHNGRVLITHTSIKPLLDDRPSANKP